MAVIGAQCSFCENTGTTETPVWSEIKLARDLTANDSMDQVDVSNRGSLFKLYVPGLRDVSIDIQVLSDSSDTRVAALATSYTTRAAKEYAVLDGKPAGPAKGIRLTGYLYNKTDAQPLADAATTQYTLKPSEAPESLTISGT